MKNKILAILLVLVMCFSMVPMSVFAAYNSTALIITGGTAGTDYTYENGGVLDIKAAGTYEIKNADATTATTDAIRVSAASGKVIVKLSGVNIKPTSKPAFEITGDCETTVILKDGTENTLDNATTTATSFAGLQNGEKVLTVTCESSGNTAHECTTDCGKLTAMSFWGAGIGGGNGGNGSNITVSGGTVTATSTRWGAGIGGGYSGSGSKITISGGTVTATSAQWGAGIGGGYNGSGSNITVSGGTVTATSAQWGAGIGGGYNGSAGNIKIAPAANTEIEVNTGANASEAEELTYAFAEETNITELVSQNAYFYSEVAHNLIVITADGVTTGYADLTDAVAAAQAAEGSTLKLMNDITITSRQDVSSGRFTLDLNGHTLLNESDAALLIRNAAELTIMDSGTGGTIRSNTSRNFAVLNYGSLTVASGRIAGAYTALNSDGTSLTVNGGTFEGGAAHSVYIVSGTAEINGGTFKGPVWSFTDYTINGGSFTADYIGINKAGGVLTINGGTFDVQSYQILDGAISITGGAFTTDPSAYAPVGYAATYDNTIGQYTVAPCTVHSWKNGVCALCGTVCTHSYGEATCEAPATCSVCRATTGDALGHKDENTDHTCERGCGKTDVGTHGDSNCDHACDYGCAVAMGTCEDADKDHDCDHGCDKVYGTHEDTDKDHDCDYGCSVAIGTCEDADKDHDCDYGCDQVYGTHEDTDKDHACDYGCAVAMGTCEDADKDHDCDYGCDKVYSTHEDTDKDHDCDYGCTVAIGTCEDTDKDHDCDYGCDKVYGTHEDTDTDHACDYGCTAAFGTHAAASGKHTCDYCGNAVTTCTDFAEVVKPEALKSAADCTNPAVYYKSCTVCGANGTETFTSGDAKGHTYTTAVTAPTCTEKGYTTYTCACGDSYVDSEVAATGHSFTEYKANGDATCTADGTKTAKCDSCEATDTAADTGSKKTHAYEKGKCTVCEAVDPDYVPESSSPQTGDHSNIMLWFILLLISATAVFAIAFYGKKEKMNKAK